MDEQTTTNGNGTRPVRGNLDAHFACVSLKFTARGPAHVVQESMVVAPMFAAVAIDVENIDDHLQREFAVDSGVSLDWTNERAERFLQEHLNALREVAASGE